MPWYTAHSVYNDFWISDTSPHNLGIHHPIPLSSVVKNQYLDPYLSILIPRSSINFYVLKHRTHKIRLLLISIMTPIHRKAVSPSHRL